MNRCFAARRRAVAAPPLVLATMVVAGAAAAQDSPVMPTGLPSATVAGAAREVPANPPAEIPASAAQPAPTLAGGQTAAQTPGTNANPQAGPDLQPGVSLNLYVIARQLNQARINIEPRVGASTYTLTPSAIQNLPGAQNTPIDNAILQMPGVDQDNLANGGLHVRNEHLNVQYRIDGVIIPDGVSFFGQDLSLHFVDSMTLITGALPAEYGLRTAGIIDIQSKSGLFNPGGSVEMYGGSYGTLNPSMEAGGAIDGYNYFVTGSYLQSNNGINDVTAKYSQIHDFTQQTHDFAYIDKIIDPNNRVSVMFGEFNGLFQIPNNPGQATFPGITAINGTPISAFDSASLNELQTEGSQFGAVSFLHSEGDLDFQVSAISKYSFLQYFPDTSLGDLAFNGISEDAARTSWANDLQAEGTYRLDPVHTLRSGILISGEHVTGQINSDVLDQLGADSFGNRIFATATTNIAANSQQTSFTYSAYLQDEWQALPTVTVNYGARFDVVNGYTKGSQLSPRLNAVWHATPTTIFHVGYARYFTPPPQELVSTENIVLYGNTSGAPASTQNSPIKNESAEYFDGGVKQHVLPGLTVGLDLYYKYAHDLIDESQFGAPIILTPFNYDKGINKGVELTTEYDVGNFTFYGNLAFANQLAKGINSAQFNFTPAQLASADSMFVNTDHSQLKTESAGAAYLWRGTRFSVDLIAGSGLRTQPANDLEFNGETVPSYQQVNLGISHVFARAPGGPVTVRLAIINLLDRIYLLRSMTGVGEFSNQYGPRRSVYLGLTKEF
ncbi:MAG TPA: TonB-dependent receptor [Stellaceae bacterium]|nr:TonB-dependent receptor [Stellaceae bacterium]